MATGKTGQEQWDERSRKAIEKNRAMLAARQREKDEAYQREWEQLTNSNTKAPDTSGFTGALSYVNPNVHMRAEAKKYNYKKKANRQTYEEQSRVPTYKPFARPNAMNNMGRGMFKPSLAMQVVQGWKNNSNNSNGSINSPSMQNPFQF